MSSKRKTAPKKGDGGQATETKRGRVENLRPWKKGQSGNPGGQPKGMSDVRAAARGYTTECIDRLAHWMRSDEARASIAAAVALLNRGWGMPQQNIKATVSDLRAMTDDDLYGFLRDNESGSGQGIAAPPRDTGKPN